MQALPKRVRELAAAFGVEQAATTGGQLEDVPFHVLAARPEVPLTLELEPGEAASLVRARLWDGVATSVFDDARFEPGGRPSLRRPVPAGHYVLTLSIEPPTPPYRAIPALPVPALPPEYKTKVDVR